MKNQTWIARVIGNVAGTDIAGSCVWLPPGRYVLTELSTTPTSVLRRITRAEVIRTRSQSDTTRWAD
jgi:hypothetical protein